MIVVQTNKGTMFVDRGEKKNIFMIVSEAPYSIEKTEFVSPIKLIEHFRRGGR